MCGMCCLNNATGGDHFQASDMLNFVKEIVDEHQSFAGEKEDTSLACTANHMSPDGDFSEEVMAAALRSKTKWVFHQETLQELGCDLSCLAQPGVAKGIVHSRNHWMALRVVHDEAWLLDSLKSAPTSEGPVAAERCMVWSRDKRIFPVMTVLADGETHRDRSERLQARSCPPDLRQHCATVVRFIRQAHTWQFQSVQART